MSIRSLLSQNDNSFIRFFLLFSMETNVFTFCQICVVILFLYIIENICFYNNQAVIIWASMRENLSLGVCEQHRRRPACASAQSDQRLCYLLFGKNRM